MNARSADWNRSDTVWAGGIAVLATLIAAFLSQRVFGGIPHVQDSIAQLFQAKIFAGGHVVAPAPPVPEFFEYTHIILKDGKWYSQYPPGHSLLLMLGVWTGQPWLVNPLLAGCAVFAMYALGRELIGTAHARLAAALALVSPFFLLMSAEFMAHASSLAALTLFLVAYLRWTRTRSRSAAAGVLAGLVLGILIRPYTAFGFALPVFAHAAGRAIRHRSAKSSGRWSALALCGSGALLGAFTLLAYNAATTGNPLRFGYEELYGPSHGLGFGKGTWGPPHTLSRGIQGALSQFRALDHRLFEWPLSSLWPLVLALLPRLPWERKITNTAGESGNAAFGAPGQARWWLLAFLFGLSLVHVFYWYRDDCFGPRYLYEALGPLLVLTSMGLLRVHSWIARILEKGRTGRSRGVRGDGGRPSSPVDSNARFVSLALLVLLIGSGLVFRWPVLFRLPETARGQGPESPYRQASYFQYFGREYWAVGPELGHAVASTVDTALAEGERALVFVRMIEPPIDDLSVRHLWFGSAFAREDPYLEHARVIYAKDLGPKNEEIVRAFPDRALFAYVGSVQGGEVRRLR